MAALQLPLFFSSALFKCRCFLEYSTTPSFQKRGSILMSYKGATTSNNNGGGLQLVDFGSALYSLPLKWGNLSRCFGDYSTGAIEMKMAPLAIVAPDSLANKKHPQSSRFWGCFWFYELLEHVNPGDNNFGPCFFVTIANKCRFPRRS